MKWEASLQAKALSRMYAILADVTSSESRKNRDAGKSTGARPA